MTDLELIRTLISDPFAYGVAEATGTGSLTEFNYPFAPMKAGTCVVLVDGVVQTLTSNYIVDEELGLVTMSSAPDDGAKVTVKAKYSMLSDTQLQGIIDLHQITLGEEAYLQLAAADCLDIIASSEAMIQKKIDMLDLKTDGAVIAESLRNHAKNLRAQVFDRDSVEAVFDIAENNEPDDAAANLDRLYKDYVRSI